MVGGMGGGSPDVPPAVNCDQGFVPGVREVSAGVRSVSPPPVAGESAVVGERDALSTMFIGPFGCGGVVCSPALSGEAAAAAESDAAFSAPPHAASARRAPSTALRTVACVVVISR